MIDDLHTQRTVPWYQLRRTWNHQYATHSKLDNPQESGAPDISHHLTVTAERKYINTYTIHHDRGRKLCETTNKAFLLF